jgi:hypothetical protein
VASVADRDRRGTLAGWVDVFGLMASGRCSSCLSGRVRCPGAAGNQRQCCGGGGAAGRYPSQGRGPGSSHRRSFTRPVTGRLGRRFGDPSADRHRMAKKPPLCASPGAASSRAGNSEYSTQPTRSGCFRVSYRAQLRISLRPEAEEWTPLSNLIRVF